MAMLPLIDAVQRRDIAEVQRLLASGVAPDVQDERAGDSALTMAAMNGDENIVEALLDAEADPNFLGTVLWPLHVAAGQGNARVVEMLLLAGADIDAQDEDGGTALSDAAAGGHIQIVEMLLEGGADPKHKDDCGRRPLIYAAEAGHEDVVELLAPLSPRADRKRAEIALRLKSNGPPSENVLRFLESARRGKMDEVRAFVEEGGFVDVVDEGGTTALGYAANKGQLEVVRWLVDHGANADHIDVCDVCPLIYAALGGKSNTYEFLYPLTEERLRKRAEMTKRDIMARGQWK